MHAPNMKMPNLRSPLGGHLTSILRSMGLLVLVALVSAPLRAQEEDPAELPDAWRGSAGLVVSVVDDDGAPLPDVRVAVRLGETPEWLTTTTEDDGRARFEGLAEGEWEVDVRREGFMLFTAFVALESGRKPKVAFSSRQRTGTYWEPLQAVFLPADVELTRGMASGRQSVNQALAEQRRRDRREEAQERRAQRAAQRGELARVEDAGPEREPVIRDLVEPAADPEPEDVVDQEPAGTSVAESSVAEPVRSTGVAPTPPSETPSDPAETGGRAEAAAPRPVKVATLAESEEASAEPPARASTSGLATEPRGTERPRMSGAAPASVEADASTPRPARYEPRDPPRRLLANPNLRPAGACPECAPGEFSVASRAQAERWERGATCSAAPLDGLEELALDVVGALDAERREFAGSLRESNGNDLLRLLPDDLRDEVVDVAQSPADSCSLVGVVLPAGGRYVGFRYQVGERSIMAECPDIQPDGSQTCQLADARWLGPPRIVEQDGVQFVLAMFENRSRRSTRLPQLVVYFEPARGWLPPSE